jgi:hypothetical protein
LGPAAIAASAGGRGLEDLDSSHDVIAEDPAGAYQPEMSVARKNLGLPRRGEQHL